MADTFRIAIQAEVEDLTPSGIRSAERNLSAFQETAQRTEERLRQLSRTPGEVRVSVSDRASGPLSRIQRDLGDLTRRTWRIAVDVAGAPFRAVGGLFNTLTSWQTLIVGYGATQAVQGLVGWPIQLADNLEQANIAFTTMLHSQQKAADFMKQVQQFAIATPFSTEDIVKNAQFMMALGFSAQQVIPALQAIGDAAAATGGGAEIIQRIILAMGQMMARGKVNANDMLQLTEANIPAWRMLADAMHMSVAQVQKLAEAGRLEAAPAIQTILQGMEKLYGGMMQQTANKTFSGLMSQIEDTFRINVLTRWGQGILSSVLPALSKFNDWLGASNSGLSRIGETVERIGQSFGAWIADRIKSVVDALDSLVNGGGMGRFADDVLAANRAMQRFVQRPPAPIDIGKFLHLAWDKVVVEPFDNWWRHGGAQKIQQIAASIGGALGGALGGFIAAALGAVPGGGKGKQNTSPFIDAGAAAGKAFLEAFLKAFDTSKIAGKLLDTLKGMAGNAATIAPGGAHPTASSWFDLIALGIIGRRGYHLTRGMINWGRSAVQTVRGWSQALRGGGAARVAAATAEEATRVAEASRGAPSVLEALAGRLGPLARTGARGLGVLAFLPDAISVLTSRGAARVRALGSAAGGAAGWWGGAQAGAAIGTMVAPGIGTAIGGALGGLVGGLAGSWGGGKIADFLQTGKLQQFARTAAQVASRAPVPTVRGLARTSAPRAAAQVAVRPQVAVSAAAPAHVEIGGVSVSISVEAGQGSPDELIAALRRNSKQIARAIADDVALEISRGIQRVAPNMQGRAVRLVTAG